MEPKDIKVSPHFSLYEVVYSDKAIELNVSNFPDPEVLVCCVRTAQELEKVRELLSAPMNVSSWFRSLPVNRAINSKDTSQHLIGEAVDFNCSGFGSPKDIAYAISQSQIQFDQLILEHSWVHISFAIRTSKPKRQVLSLLSSGGYATGLTDKLGNKYKF